MYRGGRTYNGLPDSAKHCKSLPKFKEMLRPVILLFCCVVHFSSICLFIRLYSHVFNFSLSEPTLISALLKGYSCINIGK